MSKQNKRRNTPATPVKAEKPRRIRFVDGRSACLTAALIVLCLGAIVLLEILGWFAGIVGGLLFIVLAFFTCTLFLDMGFLLSACITVADGAVNLGKGKDGKLIMFHTSSVTRMELRDAKTDAVITEDKKAYRKVKLTFVMASGRVNEKEISYITAQKLHTLRREIMGK